MTVSFCGHRGFIRTPELENKLLAILEERVGDSAVEFYLGSHGAFDAFAFDCCCKFREKHKAASLVLVTPYLSANKALELSCGQGCKYDCILYPEIENKPKRLAIIYRNAYVVKNSDLVIAYIAHTFGGAYKAFLKAKQLGVEVINLARDTQ